ncbi:MAG: hypothetical protein LIP18_06855 [Planctomycetes bacterium]|nr:hypothetical protein [Planctomycetota bacterium]
MDGGKVGGESPAPRIRVRRDGVDGGVEGGADAIRQTEWIKAGREIQRVNAVAETLAGDVAAVDRVHVFLSFPYDAFVSLP